MLPLNKPPWPTLKVVTDQFQYFEYVLVANIVFVIGFRDVVQKESKLKDKSCV